MRRIKVQSETSRSMSWENGVATRRDEKSAGKAGFGRKVSKWASDVASETLLKQPYIGALWSRFSLCGLDIDLLGPDWSRCSAACPRVPRENNYPQ